MAAIVLARDRLDGDSAGATGKGVKLEPEVDVEGLVSSRPGIRRRSSIVRVELEEPFQWNSRAAIETAREELAQQETDHRDREAELARLRAHIQTLEQGLHAHKHGGSDVRADCGNAPSLRALCSTPFSEGSPHDMGT